MSLKTYISGIFSALGSLLKGMKLTGYYFTHTKEIVTEEYPDNRADLKMAERFRGEVIMPHNEQNEHRCTGCQACELACPNGTIKIITKQETLPDGKKKKRIDTFVYRLDMCTFCNLCVLSCPSDAIVMGHNFEHSVYDKKQLKKILNLPGSKLMEGVEE
ncbi:MAG TPA: 4Fe-4S binding protein [Bacteroidia bacterium]|nr:4Fe-4S binding protein [Bacteroidia bacterium]